MSKSNAAVDVQTLMESIRQRVRAEVANSTDPNVPLIPTPASFSSERQRKAGELAHSEELSYLNRKHAFSLDPRLASITSHRPGIFGTFITKVKRKIRSYIWGA